MKCRSFALTATPVSERAASYHAAQHSPTSERPERAKHTSAEPPGHQGRETGRNSTGTADRSDRGRATGLTAN